MIRINNYSLSRAQVRQALRQYFFRSKALWIFTILVLILFFGFVGYGFLINKEKELFGAWYPVVIATAAWWVMMLIYVPWASSRKPLSLPNYENCDVEITREFIYQVCGSGFEKKFPTSGVYKAKNVTGFVLVFLSDASYLIIDKKYIDDEQQKFLLELNNID